MASGWILLDKPSGVNSRAAGNVLRRMFGAKTFGHLGTLDPMASGLLPIALDEATKMIPYIEIRDSRLENRKEYLFSVQWGIETDTGDVTGTAINQNDIIPTDEQIIEACKAFIGE